MADTLVISSLIFLVTVVALSRKLFLSAKRLPLPPGPPKLPLLGNLHNAPVDNPFITWHEWSKTYGPIMSFSVLGQTIVVLDNAQTATELLSKRAAIYSARPPSAMSRMMSPSKNESLHILLRPYDATFRLHQRLLSACMNITSQDRFNALQDVESKQLLHDLLSNVADGGGLSDEQIFSHFERAQASLTMGVSYGYRIAKPGDPITKETVRVQGIVTDMVSKPQPVDLLPALKSLPEWISPWKRAAKRLYEVESVMHMENYERGLAAPGWNFAKKIRASTGAEGTDDLHLAFLLGANTIAGLETSSRQLMWFLVAALSAPSVVSRAQKLLDSVVGQDRLPDLRDRAKLPYIDALLLELLRWRCVAPNGVPHMVEREDIYEGFCIPAGSVVISNTWGIGRDKEAFGENVEDFVPERWLKSEPAGGEKGDAEADWMHAPVRRDLPMPFFGYGRRMCTGRLLAEDGLWIVISRLLWAFDIRSAEGSVAPDPKLIRPHGFTVIPAPFTASLVPRGSWVAGVVAQEWGSAEKDASAVLGFMPDTPS